MVYQIVWTHKALESYIGNIKYLEDVWTEKEVKTFVTTVQRKIEIISSHPFLGSHRNINKHNVRFTIINKNISLIYLVKTRKKQIELLLFWNTTQHPRKLQTK